MAGDDALAEWSRSQLDHEFADIALLRLALTHRSVAQDGESRHNERLEFLGDAVLDLAVSTLLYHRFPGAAEGEMSHWRATIVNTSALGLIGKGLAMGEWLRLGRGEAASGGRDKPSILGNSLEAILGAVYLDGGWEGVERVTRRLFAFAIDQVGSAQGLGKDFKTVLQERLQAAGVALPRYVLEGVSGPPHDRWFHVVCQVNGVFSGRGEGRTKRFAEQEAARAVLLVMERSQ